jgi:hypothetical protein
VIFGYDFSPAGGGLSILDEYGQLQNRVVRIFETQQISFYTGTDFFHLFIM